MVAEDEPHAAVIGDHDAGHALGPLDFLQHVVYISRRLLQAAVGVTLHDDAAALIERNADAIAGLDLGQIADPAIVVAGRLWRHAAEILAPVRSAHFIRDPDAVSLVDC